MNVGDSIHVAYGIKKNTVGLYRWYHPYDIKKRNAVREAVKSEYKSRMALSHASNRSIDISSTTDSNSLLQAGSYPEGSPTEFLANISM